MPSPYIFKSISKTNKPRKTNSAMSKWEENSFVLSWNNFQTHKENQLKIVFVHRARSPHRPCLRKRERLLSNKILEFWRELEFYFWKKKKIFHRERFSFSLDHSLLKIPTSWYRSRTIDPLCSRFSTSIKRSIDIFFIFLDTLLFSWSCVTKFLQFSVFSR